LGNKHMNSPRYYSRIIILAMLTIIAWVETSCDHFNAHREKIERDDAAFIILESSPCYGTCPVYKIILQANGDVSYFGKMYVKKAGPVRDSISKQVFDSILKRIETSKFIGADLDYNKSKTCPQMATDNPSTFLTVKSRIKLSTIIHYYGCRGNPNLDSMEKIEEEILSATNARIKWINHEQTRNIGAELKKLIDSTVVNQNEEKLPGK
jgi:hypothetical protein